MHLLWFKFVQTLSICEHNISVCRQVEGLRVIKMMGGLQHMGDIRRKWGDLKNQGHHGHKILIIEIWITLFRLCLTKEVRMYWTEAIIEKVEYFNPSRPDLRRREKINWNFHFYFSLWCLKRFYEGLKGLHKIFWRFAKKCENRNLS